MNTKLLKALLPYLIGAGLVVLLVLGGMYLHSDGYASGYDTSDKEWKAKWEKNEKEWNVQWEKKASELVAAQAKASEEARLKEQQRVRDLEKAVKDGKDALRDALSSRDRATVDASRMLEQAKRLAAHSRCPTTDATAPSGGVPTRTSGDLLAELLGRAEARARELGEAYERARAAGVICTDSYNAQFKK